MKTYKKIFSFSLASLLMFSISFYEAPVVRASAVTIFITTTGTGTWTVPDDWNSSNNKIEIIGAGGGGRTGGSSGSGGGGGGAYTYIQNLTLTPGSSVSYKVAAGGSPTVDGGDTWFNGSGTTCSSATQSICAKGGARGTAAATAGVGGAAASCVPSANAFSGGAGGTGYTTGDTGGGGGGAAGPNGAGGKGGNAYGSSSSGGGGGGGGSNGGSAGSVGTASGSAGGAGYGYSGSGGAGSTTNGSAGTANTGAGGGGGDYKSSAGYSGGAGADGPALWTQTSDSETAGPGGGGGGTGDNGYGGAGGSYGGGGGGGSNLGGSGKQGIIIITYEPLLTPATPGSPTYSNTDTDSTRVSWTAAARADSYKVERATHSGSCGSYSQVAGGVTNLYYDDSGLSSGVTYCYRVRGTNTDGDGSYSSGTTVTTLVIPGTPGNPTYSNTTASATRVSWTAATNAASYKVERATYSGSCGSYSEIASGVTNLYYDNSGLSSNTTYCYRVRATASGGDGSYDTPTTVTTLVIPGIPGNPTFSNTDSDSTRVSWTAATDAASYKVERATYSGSCGSYSQIASGVTNLYYDDSGLSQATTYCYRVRATASGGDGSYDTPATVTTLSLVPDATSISYTQGSNGGRSGDTVTITGTNLGTVSAGSRANCSGGVGTGCIRFVVGGNDTIPDANISAWSTTSITLTLPASLASYGGTNALEVVSAGNEDATPLSYIVYPNITGLASVDANGAREHVTTDTDGLIMLIGDHLGTSTGSVHFTGAFGNVTSTIHLSTGGSCTVAGWANDGTSVCGETNSEISDIVYSGTITLSRADGKTDVWNTFNILPRITSISPTSGAPGTVIKVEGNHLCKGGSCPTFGNRTNASNTIRIGTHQIPENNFRSPGTPKATVSTPAVSLASQRLLLAFITLKNANGESVSSVSGGGLTWTKVTSVVNGSQVRVEAWKAYTESPFASAITATLSSSTRATISVIAFSNVDTSNPIGAVQTASGSSASPSISLTTTANDSLVAGILGVSDSPNLTAGSGTTLSQELHTIGGLETNRVTSGIVQKLIPISNPSSATLQSTLSNSEYWGMIALEIKKKF